MGDAQGLARQCQLRHQRVLRARCGSFARCPTARRPCDILEHDQHASAQQLRCVEPLNDDIDRLAGGAAADLDVVQQNGLSLPQRFVNDAGQGLAQAVARHGVDVDVDPARSRLQVFSGAPADVDDVAVRAHQHGGRGVGLLDQLVNLVFEIVAWGHCCSLVGASDVCRSASRKRHFGEWPAFVQTVEDACTAVLRRKQTAGGADGFGVAQQQHTVRVERVMKELQDPVL